MKINDTIFLRRFRPEIENEQVNLISAFFNNEEKNQSTYTYNVSINYDILYQDITVNLSNGEKKLSAIVDVVAENVQGEFFGDECLFKITDLNSSNNLINHVEIISKSESNEDILESEILEGNFQSELKDIFKNIVIEEQNPKNEISFNIDPEEI